MTRDPANSRWILSNLNSEMKRITQEISKRLPLLPALVSWIRIIGVPVVLFIIHRIGNMKLLFWVVLVCGVSDYMDGWLAKRTRKATYAGKVLDFTADKLFLSVTLISISITLHGIDTISASILTAYHLLVLLALSVISWSIRVPVVTITTGERLAVLFSYLLAIVAVGRLAFPGKHIFHSLLWPVTIIAVLSAILGLLSYLRLLRRFLSRILE